VGSAAIVRSSSSCSASKCRSSTPSALAGSPSPIAVTMRPIRRSIPASFGRLPLRTLPSARPVDLFREGAGELGNKIGMHQWRLESSEDGTFQNIPSDVQPVAAGSLIPRRRTAEEIGADLVFALAVLAIKPRIIGSIERLRLRHAVVRARCMPSGFSQIVMQGADAPRQVGGEGVERIGIFDDQVADNADG